MRIVFRILLIIVAALVVTGATYAVGQSDWVVENVQSTISNRAPEGRSLPDGADDQVSGSGPAVELERTAGEAAATQQGTTPGEFERHDDGRVTSPLSTASLTSFAHTLIPMASVVIAIALVSKAIDAIRRHVKPGVR